MSNNYNIFLFSKSELYRTKNTGNGKSVPHLLAEAVGFEPTSPCGLPDFERLPLWLRSSLSVPFFTRFHCKTGQNEPNSRKNDRKLIENCHMTSVRRASKIRENRLAVRFHGRYRGTKPSRFRVRAVMTTSIRFRIRSYGDDAFGL